MTAADIDLALRATDEAFAAVREHLATD